MRNAFVVLIFFGLILVGTVLAAETYWFPFDGFESGSIDPRWTIVSGSPDINEECNVMGNGIYSLRMFSPGQMTTGPDSIMTEFAAHINPRVDGDGVIWSIGNGGFFIGDTDYNVGVRVSYVADIPPYYLYEYVVDSAVVSTEQDFFVNANPSDENGDPRTIRIYHVDGGSDANIFIFGINGELLGSKKNLSVSNFTTSKIILDGNTTCYDNVSVGPRYGKVLVSSPKGVVSGIQDLNFIINHHDGNMENVYMNIVVGDINNVLVGGYSLASDYMNNISGLSCQNPSFVSDTVCSLPFSATNVFNSLGAGTYWACIDATDKDGNEEDFCMFNGYRKDVNFSGSGANIAPVVSNVFPVLNTKIDVRSAPSIDINFSLTDDQTAPDQRIDLNYSSTQDQNTGTSILVDGNVADTAGLSCDSNNLNSVTTCHYVWNWSGTPDGNHYLLVKVTDPSADYGFAASVGKLDIDSTPIVKVVSPNGGEDWNATNLGTRTIDFNVQDDQGAVGHLFDLNYSGSNLQGTGISILVDGNVADTAGLSCDSNNLNSVTTCHYVWNWKGIPDGNHFLLVGVTDSTSTNPVGFDSSDGNFYTNTSPVVRVLYPNGGEDFRDIDGYSHTIDFNVAFDGNSSNLLFDLNYSSSSIEGTGAVILNDGNTITNSNLYCDSNDLSGISTCHYVWDVRNDSTGIYRVLVSAMDDLNRVGFDSSDADFNFVRPVKVAYSQSFAQEPLVYSRPVRLDANSSVFLESVWKRATVGETRNGDYNVFVILTTDNGASFSQVDIDDWNMEVYRNSIGVELSANPHPLGTLASDGNLLFVLYQAPNFANGSGNCQGAGHCWAYFRYKTCSFLDSNCAVAGNWSAAVDFNRELSGDLNALPTNGFMSGYGYFGQVDFNADGFIHLLLPQVDGFVSGNGANLLKQGVRHFYIDYLHGGDLSSSDNWTFGGTILSVDFGAPNGLRNSGVLNYSSSWARTEESVWTGNKLYDLYSTACDTNPPCLNIGSFKMNIFSPVTGWAKGNSTTLGANEPSMSGSLSNINVVGSANPEILETYSNGISDVNSTEVLSNLELQSLDSSSVSSSSDWGVRLFFEGMATGDTNCGLFLENQKPFVGYVDYLNSWGGRTAVTKLRGTCALDENVGRVVSSRRNDANRTDVLYLVSDSNRGKTYVVFDSFYIGPDITSPLISNFYPSADLEQHTQDFAFIFSVSDSDSGVATCDYNAFLDGVAIPSLQGVAGIVSVDGLFCTVSFSYAAPEGKKVTVHASATDFAGNVSGSIVSFGETFYLTGGAGPGSVIPPQNPELPVNPLVPQRPSNPLTPLLGDVNSFCLDTFMCKAGLVCKNFKCVVPVGLDGLVLTPSIITTSPFDDVLPGKKIFLQNVAAINQIDSPYNLTVAFECVPGQSNCANFCHVTQNSQFVLAAHRTMVIKSECDIPASAQIGQVYFARIAVRDHDGHVKFVDVSVGIAQGTFSGITALLGLGSGNPIGKFFDIGLWCFGPQHDVCLLRTGDNPLPFGISYISIFDLLLVILLLGMAFGFYPQYTGPVALVLLVVKIVLWFFGR